MAADLSFIVFDIMIGGELVEIVSHDPEVIAEILNVRRLMRMKANDRVCLGGQIALGVRVADRRCNKADLRVPAALDHVLEKAVLTVTRGEAIINFIDKEIHVDQPIDQITHADELGTHYVVCCINRDLWLVNRAEVAAPVVADVGNKILEAHQHDAA